MSKEVWNLDKTLEQMHSIDILRTLHSAITEHALEQSMHRQFWRDHKLGLKNKIRRNDLLYYISDLECVLKITVLFLGA